MSNFAVAISRMCGSGGSTVGHMLAERLGVMLYDRNLLRIASDDSGINEELFARADEKLRGTTLFKAAKKVYRGELIPPESGDFTSDRNLFNYQAKVLRELAEESSFVVVGRCADYVLRENAGTVRVFITADEKSCIAHEAERNGITKKEAASMIEKINRERAEYYFYYTGNNWSHAGNYDICLNSAQLGYEGCVHMICEYMRLKGIIE